MREAERLYGTAAATRGTSKVMRRILINMMTVTNRQIRSKGRRGGGSYRRLADDTVRRKGSTKILYTKGARQGYSEFGDDTLVKSVTRPGAEFQVSEYTRTTVTFGTELEYAHYHQVGGPKIPKRPILKFIPSDVKRWEDMIIDHLTAPHRR